jgi:hypothetical protein
VALGFLNGGGGNSANFQTPSGENLAGYPKEALKKWKELPEEERRKVKLPQLNPPRLPEGGLAVRVYMRPLKRAADGAFEVITDQDIRQNPRDYPKWLTDPSERRFPARIYAEPMGDILWLTKEEVQSLVPSEPRPGATFPVPDPVRLRIVRMHLKNGTQGWLGYWKREHVRSDAVTLRVDRVSPTLRMALEGAVHVADHADPAASKTGYEAKLSGVLEYDPAKKAFVRFDLAAIGDHWGPPGEFTRPGRAPLGVAFELTRGDHPLDQAYPFALYFPGKDAYFKAERK